MDTSSFKADEVGELRQQVVNSAQAEQGTREDSGMSDESNVVRPFRRAMKGVMSLLSGDLENGTGSFQESFFEKVRSEQSAPVSETGFNRFQRALRRVRYLSQFSSKRSEKAPLGHFGGRHIIGESTPINGGVYLGAVPQEALVVDDKHGALERLYNELVLKLAEISLDRRLDESEILPEVAGLVMRRIRFDQRETQAIIERESVGPDEKVAIDMFIHEQVGVARHQVLIVAYLIERLKKRGVLTGNLTLDGMSSHLMAHDDRLIYTSQLGYLFIFDPLKHAGSL
jgi:hypothetical protein